MSGFPLTSSVMLGIVALSLTWSLTSNTRRMRQLRMQERAVPKSMRRLTVGSGTALALSGIVVVLELLTR